MKTKNILAGSLLLFAVQILILSCSEKPPQTTPQLGKDNIDSVIAALTPEDKVGMTVGDGKFLPAVDIKEVFGN